MNRATRVRKRHQLMTPEQEAAHDAKILADLNQSFPVGMVVWYWTSFAPGAPVKETRVLQPFFYVPVSGSDGKTVNQPVTFLEGKSGYVSAWHLTPPNEEQRPYLDLEVIHGGEGGRP